MVLVINFVFYSEKFSGNPLWNVHNAFWFLQSSLTTVCSSIRSIINYLQEQNHLIQKRIQNPVKQLFFFCKNSLLLPAINRFRKRLHLRCLNGSEYASAMDKYLIKVNRKFWTNIFLLVRQDILTIKLRRKKGTLSWIFWPVIFVESGLHAVFDRSLKWSTHKYFDKYKQIRKDVAFWDCN